MPTGEGTSEGAQVLPVPTGEGNYEVVAATSTKPVVIILQQFLSVVAGSLGPPLPYNVP